MKNLLDKHPNVEAFLTSRKVNVSILKTLGVEADDIKTMKDLTDLMVILKALTGNKEAKGYIDDQYSKDTALEQMNKNNP